MDLPGPLKIYILIEILIYSGLEDLFTLPIFSEKGHVPRRMRFGQCKIFREDRRTGFTAGVEVCFGIRFVGLWNIYFFMKTLYC